jgi:hypothetical protein
MGLSVAGEKQMLSLKTALTSRLFHYLVTTTRLRLGKA